MKGALTTLRAARENVDKITCKIRCHTLSISRRLLQFLSAFTIDVTGILAGAGVLGLAVGFGAQSLVKDIITGFFIIFEDQFSVGDYVQIGATIGIVEEIGLRTTKVKSLYRRSSYIPNGNIIRSSQLFHE